MKKQSFIVLVGTFLFIAGCGNNPVSNDPNYLGSLSGKSDQIPANVTACADIFYTGSDPTQIADAKTAVKDNAVPTATYSTTPCTAANRNAGICTQNASVGASGFSVKYVSYIYGASPSDLASVKQACLSGITGQSTWSN